MATIQSTNFVVQVEPVIATPEFDFGPTPSVAANAVLLTRENLRTVGAYPPRNGDTWLCNLWILQTVAGVETAVDLTGMALTGVYWDPVSLAAVTLRVGLPVGTAGQLTVSFKVTDLPTAGMYKFLITATQTDIWDLCSGWVEVLPAVPTV